MPPIEVGAPAESVDRAARDVIVDAGRLVRLANLSTRSVRSLALPTNRFTGHGIGLDVHEETYIVPGNTTALVPGMCFSKQLIPMIWRWVSTESLACA